MGSSTFSVLTPLTRQVANAIAECCAAKKTQPLDLRWGDFKRWLKEDKGLDREELRDVETHVSSVGGFTALRNSFFIASPTQGYVERVEMKTLSKLGKATVDVLANDEIFLARFREVMAALLREHKQFAPFGYSVKVSKEKTKRVVTIALSDLHLGSKLDPREGIYRYDFEEEARALASVILRVCDFKRDYREETELVIWLGGDIIRGKIHDKEGGRAIAEQGADAMWLLSQAITIAAGHYKRVTVYCSTGNHDREEGRHEGVAHEEKWNSRATLIYFGVKLAVAHLKNVTVHIPRTPFAEYAPFDHRVYATHSDTNFKTGNLGNTVNVKGLENSMKTVNLGEVSEGRAPFDLFLVGHIHVGVYAALGAAELITNPSLIPADGYASSIGYRYKKSGQVLFESTPDFVVGDHRYLFVEREVLNDKALDKVIRPFCDF